MQTSEWTIPSVSMADFEYDLPAERIAAYPLRERDASRLLVCHAQSHVIEHRTFADLPSLLPHDAMLVVNDTRVVRARIVVHKQTGGRVEFFLLDPVEPSIDPAIALGAHGETTWRCLVGGARKLRGAGSMQHRLGSGDVLTTEIAGEDEDGFLVRFRWSGDRSFAEVLEAAGRVPLPPYIKRDPEATDVADYQTVYAEFAGSVAAPTAGLHFTTRVLERIVEKGIRIARLTLHVGAGTFRQVKSSDARLHEMHQERISVSSHALEQLIAHAHRRSTSAGSPFVVVGTTSLRTLESLYWFGVRLLAHDGADSLDELFVDQWDSYRLEQTIDDLPKVSDALESINAWRRARGAERIEGTTRIMIVPGYRARVCDALITNFHQPGSTLILLVGALLGRNLWREVYDNALVSGCRFLSFGDSSLLILDDARMSLRA